jgi:hypothetical protein
VKILLAALLGGTGLLVLATPAQADENLFGYTTGAEVLPKGSGEVYIFNTVRADKGQGTYRAVDTEIEGEYGVTDRIQLSLAAQFLTIKADGLAIDGYLPLPIDKGLRFSGLELGAKFNVLSPALDDFGLAVIVSGEWNRLDPHSGQGKTEYEAHVTLAAQKYFQQGRLIWAGNFGLKAGYEDRSAIAGLPAGFDWPTDPEMEIELNASTGLSYRILPSLFVGGEMQWTSEYETEVGNERWSIFAGPTIHYGGKRLWATFTWFPQIVGGGETYPGQPSGLHLIEKTRDEFRLKLGINL